MSQQLLQKKVDLLDQYKTSLEQVIGFVNEHSIDKQPQRDLILCSVKEMCEVDLSTVQALQSIKNASQQVIPSDDTTSITELYKQQLEEAPQVDPQQHPLYNYAANLLNQEEDDDSDSTAKEVADAELESNISADQSLIYSGSLSAPKDPITKLPIKNACRNSVCKHIYEYETIMMYIARRNRKKARCPYVGCVNNNMLKTHVVRDHQLQQEIDEQKNLSMSASEITDIID